MWFTVSVAFNFISFLKIKTQKSKNGMFLCEFVCMLCSMIGHRIQVLDRLHVRIKVASPQWCEDKPQSRWAKANEISKVGGVV